MKPNQIMSTALFCLALAGCGTQVALSGRAYEEYQKSIKPYIEYWEKPGMTEQGLLHPNALSQRMVGGDVSILATGAGEASDLTIQGSAVSAGRNVSLVAEDKIRLLT